MTRFRALARRPLACGAPRPVGALLALASVLLAGACSDSTGPGPEPVSSVRSLAITPSQVEHLALGDSLELRVPAQRAAAEYAVIPYYGVDAFRPGRDGDPYTASLLVTAEGASSGLLASLDASAAGAAAGGGPLLSRASSAALDDHRPVLTDEPVRRRLERMTRRELAPRIDAARTLRRGALARGADAPSLSVAAVAQVNPTVGAIVRLNAGTESACDTAAADFRVGRVVAVSERAVIVADTANPAGGFNAGEYAHFAAAFDTLAWPVDVQAFGEPSDIDNNKRVTVFFTRAVNELTPRSVDYVVGGFFWERDLFPRQAPRAADRCAGSNEAELFYMLVPDPQGAINGNRRSKAYVQESTVGTLAHEFQHLISAARRLYVTEADDFETVWLNEGLSHVAEELVFFRAAKLQTRGRLEYARLSDSDAAFAAFNEFGTDNLRRLIAYLGDTESRSPFADDDDLETRGATWQFLRYAADRVGGDEQALWRRLINGRQAGMPNLRAALGNASLDDWFRDWAVANFADAQSPALASLDARYTFPTWGFRSVISRYRDQAGRAYALRTRTLADRTPETVTLNAGSAGYLRFAVPANQAATLRVKVAQAPRSGAVRLSVVRVR